MRVVAGRGGRSIEDFASKSCARQAGMRLYPLAQQWDRPALRTGVRATHLTNVSLILEAPVRTLKAALYINSVYIYGLAARASFVTWVKI